MISGSTVATSHDLTYLYESEKPDAASQIGENCYTDDDNGNASQFVCYTPYGEAIVDEHLTTYENPFKFSGKELDDITGLYDHGARSRNPISTLWYGVDPLWEDGPDYSPYVYCQSNPIKMIDPDGMWQQDADGNWIAEKGDNAYSLAKVLNINPSDAIGLMKEQNYRFSEGDKKVILKVGDKVSVQDQTRPIYFPNFKSNESFGYPNDPPLENLYPEFDLLLGGKTLITSGYKLLFSCFATKKVAEICSPKLLKFTGDEAIKHFYKHADQIMKVLKKSSYNLKDYINDANWIIKNGRYSEKFNGFYYYLGNAKKGESLFGFVGLKNNGQNIATFHIKTATELGLK